MRERRSSVATPAARKPKSIFSTTLFQGNSANCWNTTERSGPGPVTRLFPTVSEPVVGKSSPAAMRTPVALPQPARPTPATTSFSRTSNLTLSTAAISLPSRRTSRVTPSNTILLILPSPGRKPAVDENRLAGYVVRCRAGKEHRCTPQIAQFAVATDKRVRSHLLPALRIACDGRGQRGSEKSRCDRVHIHAMPRPRLGLRARQLHDGTLRGAVGGRIRESTDRLQRRDVDDAPPAAGDHWRSETLREKEWRIEIEPQGRIPILLRHLEHRLANVDAGRRDEDIGRAEKLARSCCASSQRMTIGKVAGQAHRASAGAFDFVTRLLELGLAPGDQHHGRARIRERERNCPAYARARAGHDRDASRKIEQGGDRHRHLCPNRRSAIEGLTREIFFQSMVGGARMGFHALQPRNPRGYLRDIATSFARHPLPGDGLEKFMHRQAAGIARSALGGKDVIRTRCLVAERNGRLLAKKKRAVASE